ncbi:MAG: DUF2089 domain-containing protein [Bacteroidota bacterium]
MTESPNADGRPEMPSLCPACGQDLLVTELSCAECRTTVKGQFSAGPLGRLPKEQQQFLLVFVRSRGSIREVERELGLSYPTVRGRLDRLIAALDAAGGEDLPAPSARRQEILGLLDRGEITASEAVERLKHAGRRMPG